MGSHLWTTLSYYALSIPGKRASVGVLTFPNFILGVNLITYDITSKKRTEEFLWLWAIMLVLLKWGLFRTSWTLVILDSKLSIRLQV